MSVLLIDLSIFSSDTTTVILLLRDQFGSAEFPLHVGLLLKNKIISIFENRSLLIIPPEFSGKCPTSWQ